MQEAERSIEILLIAQCHIFGHRIQQDISDFLIPDMIQSL